ncbi:MAG: VOC family protein [Blastomonas sp.]
MIVKEFYPVLMVDDVQGLAKFYVANFGFVERFSTDWYVHLQSASSPTCNLALLRGDHETIPPGRKARSGGIVLSFEVANVDHIYTEMKARGLPIVVELKDEPFGQRHFMTTDPAGTLIDVITPIDPSPEFEGFYQS